MNGIKILLIILFLNTVSFSQSEPSLYMEDGQLRTHVIKVYLKSKNITDKETPKLFLVSLINKINNTQLRDSCIEYCQEPFLTLPNQTWTEKVGEVEAAFTGTLLLFDLSNFEIPFYFIGNRVYPILKWDERNDTTQQVIEKSITTDHEIYIANGFGTTFWTALLCLVFLLLVYVLTKKDEKGVLGLICTFDGRISLSLLQMAVWTIAIGSTTIAFGLMKLQIPDIPNSLILLMGLSASTSAVGHWQAHRLTLKKGIEVKKSKPKLRSLLSISIEKEQDPSLAKAQLLFWTLATVTLFLVKSFIDGELWAIPDELVAFMGISQAGFLTRKQMAIKEAVEPPNEN